MFVKLCSYQEIKFRHIVAKNHKHITTLTIWSQVGYDVREVENYSIITTFYLMIDLLVNVKY